MIYSIKSKILLLVNRFHFYALLILIMYLSFFHYLFLIPLIIYILYLIKFHFFNKKVIIFMVIFLMLFIVKVNKESKIHNESNNISVVICEKEEKESYVKYIGKYRHEYVIINSKSNMYIPGDIVNFSGEISNISNFSDFDYVTYNKSKNIYKKIDAKKDRFEGHKNNLDYYRYKVSTFYNNHLDKNEKIYFDSLILAKNISDEEFKKNITFLGISYMFCVSGFHISLLCIILDKLLSLIIKTNERIKDYIIITLVGLYSLFTGFGIGVLRAFVMRLIKTINKYLRLDLTSLDICSIAFLVCLIINPLLISRIAFKYSFISTLFIILSKSLVNTKSKLLNAYIISLLCFISTLPLTINMNYQVNLLSIILGPFFLFLLTYLIMPLSYILLIMPQISYSLVKPINLYTSLIEMATKPNFLVFKMHELNPLLIIIFYLLFFLTLVSLEDKRKKYRTILFAIYLFVMFNLKFVNPFTTLNMINVGQGDSFLICDKNYNMCIDSYSSNIDYIKSKGISNIDTLIITHSDDDHIGSAVDLVKEFNVDNLYLSYYDKNEKTDELSKYVKNTRYVKAGDSFYFYDNFINVIGPLKNSNIINNISLVFEMNLNGVNILFTGDMEKEEENDIFIKKYNVDILKVPHHGSNSSMSKSLMDNLSFDTALISVGINNKYNHPSIETISKLKYKKVYMTSISNSVEIYINNGKYYVYQKAFDKILLDYSLKLKSYIINVRI